MGGRVTPVSGGPGPVRFVCALGCEQDAEVKLIFPDRPIVTGPSKGCCRLLLNHAHPRGASRSFGAEPSTGGLRCEVCDSGARRVIGPSCCGTPRLWVVLGLCLSLRWVSAADRAAIDPSKLPPAATAKVDFDRDIKPLFEGACYRCHGVERPKNGFSLTTREAALKGGDNGVDILPGRSAESPLIHYVARLVEDMEMPPAGKGQPLTADQVGLLRAWIDQGVPWSTQAPTSHVAVALTTGGGWIGVSGNERVFREQNWQKEGWTGGLERFRIQETKPGGKTVTLEGRAIPNQDDYQVGLTLEKRDLGFARFGYEQYRKYFNDAGGVYLPDGLGPYRLDQDLHLNVGKVFAELGLTAPHWPRVVLGYEYLYREGDRSTLEWGPVGTTAGVFDPANNPKAIYPAAKSIDEKTHVLRLDISHDVHGFFLEDNFRAEFYDQNNQRQDAVYYQTGQAGPDKLTLVDERYRHFQAANAFRMERQVRDWLFVSGGYLFTRLSGDAGFNLNTALTPFAAPPPPGTRFDPFWFSQELLLDQQTHVFNVNTMWGPWQGLLFSAGVQNEWLTQHGFGRVRLDEGDPLKPGPGFAQPATLASDYDKFATEENFGLRYTRIPFTVFFADARFQQESLGQYEEQNGGVHDFLDNVDATASLAEFRTGFSVSPWQKVALNAHYRHRYEKDDYNFLNDLTRAFGPPQPIGTYPGFIRSRTMFTDEAEAKLILKPAAWLKTSLSYQIIGTDYHTTTRSFSVVDPGDISPGGDLLAGKYDAHVYGVNLTIVPWRRVYLSSTFTYSDALTSTPITSQGAVAPYRGDVYNVLSSATYMLSPANDLTLSYSFNRADYGQNNAAAGLPLGIGYDWHSLNAAILHRFSKHVLGKLQYTFMNYREPTAGSANDYSAHGIFASMTFLWP